MELSLRTILDQLDKIGDAVAGRVVDAARNLAGNLNPFDREGTTEFPSGSSVVLNDERELRDTPTIPGNGAEKAQTASPSPQEPDITHKAFETVQSLSKISPDALMALNTIYENPVRLEVIEPSSTPSFVPKETIVSPSLEEGTIRSTG